MPREKDPQNALSSYLPTLNLTMPREMEDPGEPSLMVRKLLNYDPSKELSSRYFRQPFKKHLFFLYDALMDPATLAEVVGLDSIPTLQPTTVIGYKIKLYGARPALVDGTPGSPVDGVIYEFRARKNRRNWRSTKEESGERSDTYLWMRFGGAGWSSVPKRPGPPAGARRFAEGQAGS
ncbi:hypothetical protein BDD12DRAFT_808648 [Trichophaea hybrida]|nr:hypothetical protein BDD12DRAFT_808648 [Trichophaea hybrida]